ncbi:MAG: choice-of-anchor J domain-containing protein [Chitinophagaceae bacterium]|nr:choice-of-anchor J domain-containing protein [Chitinophagaceae bacterium]
MQKAFFLPAIHDIHLMNGLSNHFILKAIISIFFTAIFTVISISVQAQRGCATGKAMETYLLKYPERQAEYQKRQADFQQKYEAVRLRKAQLRVQQRLGAVVTIPVVVHIVMDNPSLVTDEQVQSQLDVLNADYAGLNADSSKIPAAFKPLFAKGNIRFCLAQRTPNNESTNGIVRVSSSATSNPGDHDPVKYANMGGSNAWNISKYLNIWVCKMSNSNDLGYAFMPGLPGLADSDVGLVAAYHAFGTIGTAEAPFNKGRTATHEIGHYFNLAHVWGSNECIESCSDSDEVDDTPNQNTCTYGTPSFPVTDNCSNNAPGIMFMNYMDYVDDAAMCMFTEGQADRMETALETFPDRSPLLHSDGCVPPLLFNNDVKVLSVDVPNNVIMYCGQSFTPSVRILNQGALPLTSVTLNVSIDGATPVSTPVTLNLASLQETIVAANTITSAVGSHTVRIYTSEPNGSPDQNTSNDTARSVFTVTGNTVNPATEGFEGAAFPAAGWGISNTSDLTDFNPVRVNTAYRSGNRSVKFDTRNFQLFGKSSILSSPDISIPITADSVKVTFWRAAAQSNSISSDTLEILFSTNCGQTFTSAYKKGGSALRTRTNISNSEFIPFEEEWVADTVDLSPYLAGQHTNVTVQFRCINGYGNNIYLDDINIYSRELPAALKNNGFIIVPNPTTGMVTVQHYPSAGNLRGIAVFSSTGQLYHSMSFSTATALNYIPIDMRNAAAGVYFVKLIYTDKTVTKKILKTN